MTSKIVFLAAAAAVLVGGVAVVSARHHDTAAGAEPSTSAAAAPRGERQVIAALTAEADRVHRSTGIPRAAIVGQAVLESDMGRGRLPREVHNWFGMRCHSGGSRHGPVAVGCRTYNDAGHPALFRTYRSLADSVTDYGLLILSMPRYRAALAHRRSVHDYLAAITAAGYATDPAYVHSVEAIIARYHLT
jgi:flagellar protein FlgJ